VLRRDPLRKAGADPRRHLVTFLSTELSREVVEKMRAEAGPREEFAVYGRDALKRAKIRIFRDWLVDQIAPFRESGMATADADG